LTQLPDEYSEVVTNEVKTLGTSSLQDIKNEVIKFYKRKYKNANKDKNNSNTKDEALTIDKEVNKRKVKCKCCGIKGHTKDKCFSKNKSCNICGMTGHLATVCRNKNKKPHRATNVTCQGMMMKKLTLLVW